MLTKAAYLKKCQQEVDVGQNSIGGKVVKIVFECALTQEEKIFLS